MTSDELWWLELLACPRCAGALAAPMTSREGSGVLRCRACGPYPVLAGVPVLVPDPAGYCARFREPILAALAERGLADERAVRTVEAFASALQQVEAQRFGDDWTGHELRGGEAPALVGGAGKLALGKLRKTGGPAEWLLERVAADSTVLELGCGAGVLSERLAAKVRRLVVADFSLRAALVARARAQRASRAQVGGVVADAEALPFRRDGFDVLVAENLVDLLEDVPAFLKRARGLAPRLLVSTPDPTLGTGEETALVSLAGQSGFSVASVTDGVPWIRQGSARFVEVYLVQLLDLTRRVRPKARARRASRGVAKSP